MKKLIGTKKFYRRLLTIALPLMLQQLITASVQLVDNVMVGALGEESIGAISIINQLNFILILLAFGLMSGGGIYAAQYFGSGDYSKLKQAFRFKVISAVFISLLAFTIYTVYGRELLMLFTSNPNTIALGGSYLQLSKYAIVIWILSMTISSTFRDIGQTKPLMYISILAISINTLFNYILIFGKFGFPELGVEGAAIATLIARIVELMAYYVLLRAKGELFNTSFTNITKIEKTVFKGIMLVALPLMANELFWSGAQTMFFRAYSSRGDYALAAMNITNVVSQLVFVSFMAMGTASSVMVGNTLGENKLEEAKDNSVKIIAFAIFIAMVTGSLLLIVSTFIMNIYSVEQITKDIAIFCIRVNALFIPFYAYNVVMYFTLRAGGDVKSTVLMDSVFMWIIPVPISIYLAYYTKTDVTIMFLIIQSMDIVKAVFATYRYRLGYWIKNLAIET